MDFDLVFILNDQGWVPVLSQSNIKLGFEFTFAKCLQSSILLCLLNLDNVERE
jgi:hypothetical protein